MVVLECAVLYLNPLISDSVILYIQVATTYFAGF